MHSEVAILRTRQRCKLPPARVNKSSDIPPQPDLTQAFGSNGYRNAYQHWLDHGIKEGRHSIPGLQAGLFSASGQLLPQAARLAFASAPEVLALRDPLTTIEIGPATEHGYQIHKDWENHPALSPDSSDKEAGGGKRWRMFRSKSA